MRIEIEPAEGPNGATVYTVTVTTAAGKITSEAFRSREEAERFAREERSLPLNQDKPGGGCTS